MLWSKQYQTSGSAIVRALAEMADGSFFIGGSISSSDDTNDDFLLGKVDAKGAVQWFRRLKGPKPNDRIEALLAASDGYLYAAGTYGVAYDSINPKDPASTYGWAAKFSAAGDAVWSIAYSSQRAVAISEGAPGKFVLGGEGEATTPELHPEAWALGLGADGSVLWSQRFGFNSKTHAVAATKDGGAILAGVSDYAAGNPEKSKGLLARINSSGKSVWSWNYVSPDKKSSLHFVQERPDGRLIAGGYRVPETATAQSWWLSLPADGRGDADVEAVDIVAASGVDRSLVLTKAQASLSKIDLQVTSEDLKRKLASESSPKPEVVRAPFKG